MNRSSYDMVKNESIHLIANQFEALYFKNLIFYTSDRFIIFFFIKVC